MYAYHPEITVRVAYDLKPCQCNVSSRFDCVVAGRTSMTISTILMVMTPACDYLYVPMGRRRGKANVVEVVEGALRRVWVGRVRCLCFAVSGMGWMT